MKSFLCKKNKGIIHDITGHFMTYLKKNKYYSTQTFWMWFLNVSSQLFVSQLVMTTNTVSYTHLTLPTTLVKCRSRWSPYH